MKGGAMPRYFFHVCQDGETNPDLEGIECADLDAVRQECREAAREIMAENLRNGAVLNGRAFHVSDETGAEVLTLSFEDALPPLR
jgi:hypothetical protein